MVVIYVGVSDNSVWLHCVLTPAFVSKIRACIHGWHQRDGLLCRRAVAEARFSFALVRGVDVGDKASLEVGTIFLIRAFVSSFGAESL